MLIVISNWTKKIHFHFSLDGARHMTTGKTQFSQRKEHPNFCISENSFARTKTRYYYIIRVQFM